MLAKASDFSSSQLAAGFNAGFEGYFRPLSVTPEELGAMNAEFGIDLDQSVVFVTPAEAENTEKTVVGIAFLAIRGTTGWVGGMGTAKAHRRTGIGKKVIQQLLQNAKQYGLKQVWLECITLNTGAHALYKQVGFQDTCRVSVMKGTNVTPSKTEVAGVKQVQAEEAWKHLENIPTDQKEPKIRWQDEPETLAGATGRTVTYWLQTNGQPDNAAAEGDGQSGDVSGVVVVSERKGGDGSVVCFHNGGGVVEDIIDHLLVLHKGAVFTGHNLALDRPLCKCLLTRGLEHDLQQDVMVHNLEG
eukprot:TRINITY_DN68120_c1_g5_i1.p1 TRINITY_DN68120_c1_g5~~TRINITY_DN68120_c1_g5_i1.p1  ORF type:complete len:301 (-),score=28.81 TRINITY_DN68120_c1_g5_i1:761-1663(-)